MDEVSLNRRLALIVIFCSSFRIRFLQNYCSHWADTEENTKRSMRSAEWGNSSKAVKWEQYKSSDMTVTIICIFYYGQW